MLSKRIDRITRKQKQLQNKVVTKKSSGFCSVEQPSHDTGEKKEGKKKEKKERKKKGTSLVKSGRSIPSSYRFNLSRLPYALL